MKTVGIIGGLGPETTAIFYQEVVSSWIGQGNVSRPQILIWNVPISFRLEKSFMNSTKDKDEFFALLAEGVDRLQSAGCDFIVIPCNTAHILIDELRSHAKVPVLSIVTETINCLVKNDVKSLGILATPTAIKSRLYDAQMNIASIHPIYPKESDFIKLGKIIGKLTNNQYGSVEKQEFEGICSRLTSKKVDALLLACTDLQIITPKTSNTVIFDTLKILVDATVRELQKRK